MLYKLSSTVALPCGPGDVAAAGRTITLAPVSMVKAAVEMAQGQAAGLIKHASAQVGVATELVTRGSQSLGRAAISSVPRGYISKLTDKNAKVLCCDLPRSAFRRNPNCEDDFARMPLMTLKEVLQAAERLLAPTKDRR